MDLRETCCEHRLQKDIAEDLFLMADFGINKFWTAFC